MWFSDEIYDPIQAGSIDGTDTIPHDHGILRASKATCKIFIIIIIKIKTIFFCKMILIRMKK